MKRLLCVLLGIGMLLPLLGSPAVMETAASVTYVLPEDVSLENLTDERVMTRSTVEKGDRIELRFENGGEGKTVWIEWYALPEKVAVLRYDAEDNLLSETVIEEPSAWWMNVALESDCVRVALVAKEEFVCSTLKVTEGETEQAVLLDSPESVDLLFVLAEPNDLWELVGNLFIKYRLEHRMQVGIVLLSDGRRYEQEELEDSLLALGITEAPILLHCSDKNYNAADEVHNSWSKQKPQELLSEVINAVTPKVLVTTPKESGNVRHGETNAVLAEALTLITHSVSKVYELDEAGSTVVDCSNACPLLDGKSAAETAQEAYGTCRSRGVYRYDIPTEAHLRLLSSAVGEDVEGADLLEHLELSALSSYENVTPAPVWTDAPTEAPTEQPTEAPATEAPTEAPTEQPTEAPTEAPKRKGLFSCGGEEVTPTLAPTEQPTEAPTEQPTEPPTPLPTETPTEVPTEAPTPFVSEIDSHFYQEGKGEYVFMDAEKGEWIYRNESLAVEIHRYETTYYRSNKVEPAVYFVADIYERNYDSFRPVFGSEHHNGIALAEAMDMADRMQCVLWLTGDNIIQADKEAKGILIRDGYVFQRTNRIDGCSLNSETLSLDLVHRSGNTAQAVIESGAQNVFSFGPILVENGEIPEDARATRKKLNPRTAIGMVEPGHLVAVVVDGRQPGYSLGVSGGELAELMVAHGCVSAYNLDGGISATMIFLGNKINRHGEEDYNGVQASPRVMPDGLTWGYSPAHYGMYRETVGNE